MAKMFEWTIENKSASNIFVQEVLYWRSCHQTKFVNSAFVLIFLFSGKFAAPLWVLACTVLLCGGTGCNKSELLCVRNIRGLSAGTADGSFDVICSIQGVVCNSKGYMSRLC